MWEATLSELEMKISEVRLILHRYTVIFLVVFYDFVIEFQIFGNLTEITVMKKITKCL